MKVWYQYIGAYLLLCHALHVAILTSPTADIQREKFTWDASDSHLMCPS